MHLYAGVAIGLLLILTVFGNAWLLLGAAVILLLAGFTLFPERQTRGLITVIVGGALAAGLSFLLVMRGF